jgi:Fe2+ or Zn2+ uptake regulation protein
LRIVRETSIDVYHKIEEEGLLSRLRFQVYSVLFHHGPMTAMEVCEKLKELKMPVKQVSVSPRMSELRDRGVVKECGEKLCAVTQHNSILWDVTNKLPAGPVEDEISKLREKILKKEIELEKLRERLMILTGKQVHKAEPLPLFGDEILHKLWQ